MELKHLVDRLDTFGTELLIVPYGIETLSAEPDSSASLAFNRTLWN